MRIPHLLPTHTHPVACFQSPFGKCQGHGVAKARRSFDFHSFAIDFNPIKRGIARALSI